MQETALTGAGGLRLDGKAWWNKAAALEVGESFLVEDGKALVRREMGSAVGMDVPLDVSVGRGRSWHEAAH